MTKTTVQQFSFITPLFSDTCRHTKNKSPRRCRLYFRCRMHCWWIFDVETDYNKIFDNLLYSRVKNGLLPRIRTFREITFFML
jgi:hypothetical protein